MKGEKRLDQNEFCMRAMQIKEKLYRIAYMYLYSRDMALEAVDESIYKGLKSIKKLREPEYMETWLIRILINECNQELRRRKREVFYEMIPESSVEQYDGLELKEAIVRLPVELKEVIILRYFSDYTIVKTAEILNIPQGTVVTRQRKALKLLKLELVEREEAV